MKKNIRGYFFYKNFNYLYKLYLLYIKHNIFFPRKSYSMLGEDLFISKFFKNINNGFYVDVGAYHPFFWNNTYLLYKKKWEGINIDMNPVSVEIFNLARPTDYNVNAAITNKNKKNVKYYSRNMINALATTVKSAAKTSFLKGNYFEEKVRCSKLNTVIAKTKFKNRKIDFLNIDTEKNEVEVLKSLNFKKYKPKLILVEIHSKNKKALKSHPTYVYLRKKKYKKIGQKGDTYFFLPKDK